MKALNDIDWMLNRGRKNINQIDNAASDQRKDQQLKDFTFEFRQPDIYITIHANSLLPESVAALNERFVNCQAAEIANINIDLAKLQEMSFFFLGSLITISQKLQPKKINLVNTQPVVRDFLQWSEFLEYSRRSNNCFEVLT